MMPGRGEEEVAVAKAGSEGAAEEEWEMRRAVGFVARDRDSSLECALTLEG